MRPDLFDAIAKEAEPLLDQLQPGTRVLVWGAGEHGRWLMERLGDAGIGFVDVNPAKRGTEVAGKPVYAVHELERIERDELWVAVLSDAQSIRDRLEADGLTEGRDFRMPFPGGKRRQVLDTLPRTFSFLEGIDLTNKDVLEVGFGGQLYLSLTLLHLGARSVIVTDVEPQTAALEEREEDWVSFLRYLGREYGPAADEPLELLRRLAVHPLGTSAAALPFDEDFFDVVANTGVMEHVDDPRSAITEFARVLRPDGWALNLAIGIHDHRANDPRSGYTPWSFLEASEEDWGSASTNAYHQNRWRAIDFERTYREYGFSLRKVEKVCDPRLTAEEIERFHPSYRYGYAPEELAELDLYLAAQRRS